ncbi:MAG: type I DNA topoisomerase [Prevotellaceae bacterium]|jgi:DNA topoisomerase-1|nr:type I DNA topoisomerase [Prevotellaceae bacterium]
MQIENLVIVESPAKAKTIEKFLGKNFLVKSSYGHIRDLAKKDLGVDIKHEYTPEYVISENKEKIVSELKKLAKSAKIVWLASDEDREGEAIAWHLMEVLELDPKKTRRIVFHEIIKDAILNAIKNPRDININLVDAQQARRVLDRLVGFEVSPILWKKVKPSLSAGRVQSVAVRLIVEREREIIDFKSFSYFKVLGQFVPADPKEKFKLKADLTQNFKTEKEAFCFLDDCKTSDYKITSVEKKPSKKSPAAPFTTSTLQQEASRKYGFSVAQTMSVAQRLYEAGLITYMRTDSTNLSGLAINTARKTIENLYGREYSKVRQYKTKTKGAQEAHEAIRPTYMENHEIEGTAQEKKLYELIWKRTVASQMSDAALERTIVDINISNRPEKFQATGEVLLFDGFLKVYMESHDEEHEENANTSLLPPLKIGQQLNVTEITATERFVQHPPRYSEASLVKKMEELGIGRPSTYAPTISTIINRGYVLKEDRPGVERKYKQLTLGQDKISSSDLKEITGTEKSKLFPSDIGILVNDFLGEHFKNILDFGFTAKVEEQFDEIAAGDLQWTKMIDNFYKPFHKTVKETLEVSRPANSGRVLGKDPKTGKTVSVRIGRFGPIAQLGDSEGDEKLQYVGLQKGQLIETIMLEEALKLFELPRNVGQYEGKELVAAIGRFGPYIRFGSNFVSLKRGIDDPYMVTEERAIELIEEKRNKDKEKLIKNFDNLQILNGRYGPYISFEKENYRIPKGVEAALLTLEEAMGIVNKQKEKGGDKKTKAALKAKSAGGTKTMKTKKTAGTKTKKK